MTKISVVIEDIKTGKQKDADREQVLTYAWLWWRDERRNPKGRLATRLRIQYLDSSVDIPVPDEAEWKKFEQDLMDRTAAALAQIPEESCEARPDADNCRHCEVRQLCDAYWDEVVSGEPDAHQYGDVEAELVGVLSPKTWQVKVTSGSAFAAGSTVLLRGTLPEKPAATGSSIRVLDAMFVQPSTDQSPDDAPTIQLRTQSEVFVRQATAT